MSGDDARETGGAGWSLDPDLLEAFGAGVWLVGGPDSAAAEAQTPAFPTLAANARVADLLGVPPAEMARVQILDRASPADRQSLHQYLERALAEPVPRREVAFRRADGAAVWVILSATALHNPTSETTALLCVLTDITDRRREEDRLRQSEDRYRVLVESSQDQIFVIDRDDRVEYVNRAAAERFHTSPDQLIGRLRSDIFPPDVAARQSRNLGQVIGTGQPLQAEGPALYGDGEVWLATSLVPLLDAEGGVRAVLGVSRDITARRKGEERLRAAEQRLRAVLANAPLVLWVSDRDGRFTFCAGRALTALGLTPEAVVGRSTEDLQTAGMAGLGEYGSRALAGESFRAQMQWRDATFEEWYAPLEDEQGAVSGVIGVGVDVTEWRTLEEQLSKAQRMDAIGRLAGGIAHDFNNNLTAILGFAELILSQIGDDKPISGDLREMQRAANRAADLVRRLLAFGRRQVFQPVALDVNQVIESLQGMLERLIGDRIEITTDLMANPPLVSGDPGQLEQVVMNLVLNARDAMPDGGTLRISTGDVDIAPGDRLRPSSVPPGRYLRLAVRDSGVGMDAPTKAQLFEPFFTTKPIGEGTGLGLSTVYGIIRQFNGFLHVESEVGKGSTFQVFMPALDRAARQPAAAAANVSTGALVGRETILLVEDEETVRRFARVALERHGFRVIEASSVGEALIQVEAAETPIDLVLTDVVMPGGNGPEFADRLRQMRPDVAVLYMSGYPAGMIRDGALDPSVRLLAKPFTTVELLASIRELLAER